ncbi:H-NS histone family protein (plasmid) [Burkholderia thailandensis]|uniref:H-NS histone family protein n=1 Tax=Burkholderia thailandensis TaxID=57975 RepID=UPI00192D7C64|nr:H-NS histone family protein [Burkholderia thailandensis]MBS2132095.1 H-NS histone family protein [Burkholderia thailandensis]QRA15207.1 H-NS histone family protein [Burkholderia thailandensis]
MNNASLRELLKQREALEARIQQEKDIGRGKALQTIRGLMAEFDIHVSDLGGNRKRGPQKITPPAPKYRDPLSGATWTGRGKPPRWIAGQDRERFAI